MEAAKTKAFEKTIRPGTILEGKRRASIFCKIRYADERLSIRGVIGPLRNGDATGGCGQIAMGFSHRNPSHNDKRYNAPTRPDQIEFADGWTVDLWLDFLEAWELYHLNDMQAGCEHQRADWDCSDLDTVIGKVCEVCDYRYGSAWLTMPVPDATLAFLANLPDTDRTPAWV